MAIKQILLFVYPNILKLLNVKWVDHDFEQFVMSMIKQTLEYRETNNIFRPDFFQLLIQLRNVGIVQKDGHWDTRINNDGNLINFFYKFYKLYKLYIYQYFY